MASSGSSAVSGEPVITKMEFAVQMSCRSCEDAVKNALENEAGVRSVYVNLSDEVVIVESSLPSSRVMSLLQGTGKLVVFRGYGGVTQQSSIHHGAAVAVMRGAGGVGGLTRLVQVTPDRCLVEGTIDGLVPGLHSLTVCEYGDLTRGCDSCGPIYGGELGVVGEVTTDDKGRAAFQLVSERLKVYDIVGRSMVVSTGGDERVMCGIIARSAGLFQNTKKVCTCDGVTIWDEAKKTQDSVKAAL